MLKLEEERGALERAAEGLFEGFKGECGEWVEVCLRDLETRSGSVVGVCARMGNVVGQDKGEGEGEVESKEKDEEDDDIVVIEHPLPSLPRPPCIPNEERNLARRHLRKQQQRLKLEHKSLRREKKLLRREKKLLRKEKKLSGQEKKLLRREWELLRRVQVQVDSRF
jgi:hypothetical protein